MLERLLRRQLGKLPARGARASAEARSKELIRWAERCLTAQSLDDVLGD